MEREDMQTSEGEIQWILEQILEILKKILAK